ncbi:NUDIX domain-containing protein [Streptomyces sp. NRRL S-241]|uniref:NUDIX domain-containing protein n=1 Tax=Streptomyces sp. NRRL S-241 TaxID=1463896 RepID=UPI003B63C626
MHRRGAFELAGGTVEPGESFAEAAVRELHERPASQAIPPDAAHLDITSALRHWQRDPADLASTPALGPARTWRVVVTARRSC